MGQFGSHTKTDPREYTLVRKLDWHILPIHWLMYLFTYLDRNALLNARIDDLEERLNLAGTEYNTCVSILFVGTTSPFQIPSNIILTRVKPSWYMAGFWLGLKQAAADWRTWVLTLVQDKILSLSWARALGIYFNERTWHITVCNSIVIIGLILPVATFSVPARIVGIFLFVGFTFGINNIILGLASSTLEQIQSKGNPSLWPSTNSSGNMPSIYMPYIWDKKFAPRYVPPWLASIAFLAGCVALAWSLKAGAEMAK